jgi:hypothetical protein
MTKQVQGGVEGGGDMSYSARWRLGNEHRMTESVEGRRKMNQVDESTLI